MAEMNTTMSVTQTNQELTIAMYLYYFHLKSLNNSNFLCDTQSITKI